MNLNVAVVFSQVLLGDDDVSVAHTLDTGSLCSFHATLSFGGSTDNGAGAHPWFLALLGAYLMLHQILRLTRREKAQGTSV